MIALLRQDGRACFYRAGGLLFTMDGSTRHAWRDALDMLEYLKRVEYAD